MFVIDEGQMIYGVETEYTLELPPAFTTTGGTGRICASKKPKYRHHWSWNYVNEK